MPNKTSFLLWLCARRPLTALTRALDMACRYDQQLADHIIAASCSYTFTAWTKPASHDSLKKSYHSLAGGSIPTSTRLRQQRQEHCADVMAGSTWLLICQTTTSVVATTAEGDLRRASAPEQAAEGATGTLVQQVLACDSASECQVVAERHCGLLRTPDDTPRSVHGYQR